MRHIENLFWLICLAAIGLGLFVPQVAPPSKPCAPMFLMGILFFTCLKIEWHEILHHVRRPLFVAYLVVMVLVVTPLVVWGAARLLLPTFVLGLVILASMPSGMAGSSLTQVAGGNAALALVGTAVTTLLAPLTVPVMVWVLGGASAGQDFTALLKKLLGQTVWLSAVLFAPAILAGVVRHFLPRWVERNKTRFTGLSIISLGLLILSIVGANSAAMHHLARETPWRAVELFAFMAGFSGLLHLSAFAWAWWHPWQDKVAISINTAYVNNGLAMTFAATFFTDAAGRALPEAVLPAVAVEITMVLAILPLRRWAQHRLRQDRERAGATALVPAAANHPDCVFK